MIQESNGFLTFDFSKINNPQLEAMASEVVFLRHGSTVFIKNKADDKLICQFNPFDNTIFICDPRGYAVANLLGTKRFPVGAARKDINEIKANAVNAIQFPRDFNFPLERPSKTLPEPLKIVSRPQSYSELTDMLVRSSGFTPEKIEEYKKSGDIYCRFNPINQAAQFGCFSCQIFIADSTKNDKTVGAVVADILVSDSGLIDVYMRDEIVEPPCTLSDLFDAARTVVNQKLSSMDRLYRPDQATAFIRAAQGKEKPYIELGCGSTSPGIYVIHGQRTELAEAIDSYVKLVSTPMAAPRHTLLRQQQILMEPPIPSELLPNDPSAINKTLINPKWK
jgi:hypothetical protein